MQFLPLNLQQWLLITFLVFTASSLKAQLFIKGDLFSEGPVRASFKMNKDTTTYFMYLEAKKKTQRNGMEVHQTKYELPWDIQRGDDYTISFTDGTVEKVIFVQGAVPENVIPKQKFIIDIDLTNSRNADVMLVVFYSMDLREYTALPYTELEEIKRQSADPTIW